MKYYVSKGYVGNCLLWWRKGGYGYTCDLSDAEIFTETDPKFQSVSKDEKYTLWDADYIIKHTESHVNGDKIDRNMSGAKQ